MEAMHAVWRRPRKNVKHGMFSGRVIEPVRSHNDSGVVDMPLKVCVNCE
jgi:hypothetical protein